MKIKKFFISVILITLFVETGFSTEDDYYLGFYLTYTISEISLNIKEWDENYDESSSNTTCNESRCTTIYPPGRSRFGLLQENKGYGEFSGKITLTSSDTDVDPKSYIYDFQIKKSDGTISSSSRALFVVDGDVTRTT